MWLEFCATNQSTTKQNFDKKETKSVNVPPFRATNTKNPLHLARSATIFLSITGFLLKEFFLNWGSSVYFLKELKTRHLSIWKSTYITPMIAVALAWKVLLLTI